MREVESIIVMFLLVQALGLYVGAVMSENALNPEISTLNVSPTHDSSNALNPLYFLLVVIAGAAFLLVLIRFYKGVMAFRALESFIIFFASLVVFYIILFSLKGTALGPALGTALFPGTVLEGLVREWLSFALAISLAILKFRIPSLKNAAAIISSAGVGAIFGFSLDLAYAALFLVGLSIYDYVAVFKTKHMLTMARELGKRNMSFSVTAESVSNRKPTKAEMKGLKEKAKEKGEEPKKFIEERSHLELGTGDLAIPLMLSVSAFRFGGIGYAAAALIGSAAGLYFVLDYVFTRKTFMPALPPIAAGSLLALGIAWLVGMVV